MAFVGGSNDSQRTTVLKKTITPQFGAVKNDENAGIVHNTVVAKELKPRFVNN